MKADLAAALSRFASDYFERKITATICAVDDARDLVTFEPALSAPEEREFFAALKSILLSISIAPLAGATGDA
jgi:hypothetical protein